MFFIKNFQILKENNKNKNNNNNENNIQASSLISSGQYIASNSSRQNPDESLLSIKILYFY